MKLRQIALCLLVLAFVVVGYGQGQASVIPGLFNTLTVHQRNITPSIGRFTNAPIHHRTIHRNDAIRLLLIVKIIMMQLMNQ